MIRCISNQTVGFSGCINGVVGPKLDFSFEKCDSIIEYDNETGSYTINWKDEINKTIWIDNSSLDILAHVTINCAECMAGGSYDIMNDTLVLYYNVKRTPMFAHCMCTHTLYYNFTNLEQKDYHFQLVEIIDDP